MTVKELIKEIKYWLSQYHDYEVFCEKHFIKKQGKLRFVLFQILFKVSEKR